MAAVTAGLNARRTAAAAVLAGYRAAVASAPLAKPPGREWMLRLASVLEDLLAASGGGPVPAKVPGPFEAERKPQACPPAGHL